MIDVERLLDLYRKNTTVNCGDGCIFITPPFFHTKSDDSITIKVSESDGGLPVFSDCHTTIDYLEERDIYISDHDKRLQKIIRRFGLTMDKNVFRLQVPSTDDTYVELYLGYFIQALSVIANIDL